MQENKKVDWNELFQKVLDVSKRVLVFLWKYIKIGVVLLWDLLKILGAIILKYSVIAGTYTYAFVKKNYKERWFQIGAGASLIIIVLLIVFTGGSKVVPISERTVDFTESVEPSSKETSYNVKDLSMEITLPSDFTESEKELNIKPVIVQMPSFAVDGFTFDVDLDGQHMLPGVVEITVAYDKDLVPKGEDASNYISAMYHNGTDWEYVHYQVDDRSGEVIIQTDHFSIFGIFFGDDHPESKEVEPIIPERKIDTINPAAVDGVSLAWAEVNKYAGISSKTGTFVDGVLELTPEAAQTVGFLKANSSLSVFNNVLDNYGKGVFYFGLAQSVYEGKYDQASFAVIKQIGETVIGGFSTSVKKFGGAAMFAIDYSLNEFIKEAFDGAEANWEKTYNRYYDKEEYMGKSALYWRDFVLNIYDETPPEDYFGNELYVDYVNAKIDKKIDEHLEHIWTDIEGAYLAASDLGIGRLNIPSQTVKDKLEANYKKELYDERIVPAFASVNKILAERAELARELELKEIAKKLTEDHTIFINTTMTGTYKITDGSKVLTEGNLSEDVIYSLSDYIALEAGNLYLEVTTDSTFTVDLPGDFPNALYSTIDLGGGAEETHIITREEILSEWELDFDAFIEKEEMLIEEGYSIIMDLKDNAGLEYTHSFEADDYYQADVNGSTFHLTVMNDSTKNEENFGYPYEVVNYYTYDGLFVYLDENDNIITLSYNNGNERVEKFYWNQELEYNSYAVNNGDEYRRHFKDDEVIQETYRYSSGEFYEIFYENSQVTGTRIDGIMTPLNR